MNNKKTKIQKVCTTTGLGVSSTTKRTHAQSVSRTTVSSLKSTDELSVSTDSSPTTIEPETRVNIEGISFVCLDLPFQSIGNLFNSLRAINDYIQIFTDPSLCLDWIQSSSDSIFFISSSSDRDFITTVHALVVVEAIFILNSEAQVSKNEFPKLAGVFNQHKDLLLVLEDTLTWFERGKLEVFAFEHDKIFLWSQLWKEEVSE
jgi:hypothetical protein